MWIWFAIAAIALILELLSGTFVLLLICLGAIAAGAAAWFELGIIIQLALLAIIPVIGIFVLKRIGKFHLRNPLASEADSNLNLDIGKSVYVDDWDLERRRTQLKFRGAQWQAKPAEDYDELRTGKHMIVAIKGIILIIKPLGGN